MNNLFRCVLRVKFRNFSCSHANYKIIKMNHWKQSFDKGDGKCLIECTVVSGFENEAAEECFRKLGAKPSHSRGRIVFEMPIGEVSKVLALKSIDNVYVVIKYVPTFGFTSDKAVCLEKLNSIIDSCHWEKGLTVWQHATGYNLLSQSTILAGKKLDGEIQSGSDTPVTAQSAAINETTVPSAAGPQTPDLLRDIAGFTRREPVRGASAASHQPIVESPTIPNDATEVVEASPRDQAGGDVIAEQVAEIGKTLSDLENSSLQTDTKDEEKEPHHNFKFRVTCHRAGGEHSFSSPEAAIHFGSAVQTYFSWKPDMTQYDLEVVLKIVAESVYVSLSLTRQSLHKRYITVFGKTTLRSTIAFNMLLMAGICDGDVVCDPMCGTGVIPVEGALSWPKSTFLCGDIDMAAPEKTQRNVSNYNDEFTKDGTKLNRPLCLDIFHWDATCLPLKGNSVDVFVTDLPFGKRCGRRYDNQKLYPDVLFEMARVANLKKGRAVVISGDHRSLISALKRVTRYWRDVRHVTVNIGGLNAGVHYLERRSDAPYRGSGGY